MRKVRDTKPIDVWNVGTFDKDLMAELRHNADLVRDYTAAERSLDLEREASGLADPPPGNPHCVAYLDFLDGFAERMQTLTIRGWHYTRLTDYEVETLRTGGIYLSTPETTRRRLDAQVTAGQILVETADLLLLGSPFHDREQFESRVNKFWVTSHPHDVKNRDVTLLLSNWGGEAVYFWQTDPQLQDVVSRIGKARVIEVAVPLDATRGCYWASKAVVATFARTLGCVPDFVAFDLCAIRPLGAEAILAVHTEGEAAFEALGSGYPINYRVFEP